MIIIRKLLIMSNNYHITTMPFVQDILLSFILSKHMSDYLFDYLLIPQLNATAIKH